MKSTTLSLSFALLPLASLFAQREGPTQELTVSGSFSTAATTRSEGRTLGDVDAQFADLKIGLGRTPLLAGMFTYGISGEVITVGRETGNPLPGTLAGAGIDLGYLQSLSETDRVLVATTVGQYGTGTNVTGLAVFQRTQSSTLTWSVGAVFDVQGRFPVIPIAGLVWKATPELTVRVGAPRAEVSYALTQAWTAGFGLGAAGGTFRTGSIGSSPGSGRSLSDAWVDVREIRVGPSLAWQPNPGMFIRVEAGWVADRRFEFDDRDVTFRSDDAAYGGLTAQWRF